MASQNPSKTQELPRLDKWLWAARFFKTRALAREMVQAGKVHYNGVRSKPGRNVEVGAMIRIPSGWDIKEVEVLALADKRLSAPLAQQLYRETEASEQKREENRQARQLSAFHSPKPEHKPDKKQRRQIIRFKQQ
ncbi:heat-shock protein [Alteromonas aestuariivivens]|uniref:Heat shock protein 15 n=1 Tax=Alteromonas aestuariivivens TaxID=1938339 RepID=A0A3D8M5I4_9ALTE|nr:S4 domain-containing protein [Alteromonas aestuariivivens]RDV24881.1 heat-shock protein [Alteromonas aestuariivivens]